MRATSIKKMAEAAKAASRLMSMATTEQKNGALAAIASSLKREQATILQANQEDIAQAQAAGLSASMIDRLSLEGRLEGILHDIEKVRKLPDPVGELIDEKMIQGELEIAKYRTPIGVLGVIYESRPNVTIDVSVLSLKSGNCVILRGGSESLQTNKVLVEIMKKSVESVQLPAEAIQFVSNPDRMLMKKMLRLHDFIDLIIPRGGASLHQFCRQHSSIPVITGGVGICHLFVDETADMERALEVIVNAKTQRPTVCNALDTLLVHEKIASVFVSKVIAILHKKGVHFKLDPIGWGMIGGDLHSCCTLAETEDWSTEWLSLILGIKVVKNLDAAVKHIVKHSSGHSDGILTANKLHAERFVNAIDSAAVYVNASTRFTDGGQLGLGAEVAISTQKLHARGPMGLRELTSYKWVISGNYSVRR